MRTTLLYDGGCRFCRFAARTIVRLDREGTLAVLPFAEPEAQRLLEQIPAAERLTSWHLVREDGRRASRGRGSVELLGELRLMQQLAPVLRLLRLLPLESLYGLVARNRGRLGRIVPDGPAPRRR